MTMFDYAEMTTRNRGFVTPEEQQRLREACVFVPGVGGMGGAAVMALLRAGVGKLIIADIDTFETSNLNRQLFSYAETIGRPKAEAVRDLALTINPTLEVEVLGGEWVEELDRILPASSVAINGTDDAAAGAQLYRKARTHRRILIDAYAAPLPSVTVVRPDDPRIEERLSYPTIGVDWTSIDRDMATECLMREIEYVLTHSSSHKYVDLDVAAEVAQGKRSRFSFSTMVTEAGTMMAEEAIRVILDRPGGTDNRGYFFNPHAVRVERPLPAPIAFFKRAIVRRFMKKLMG
ncbi:ThiF family adenylyltransferase [Sphingomonas sp. LY29]|uniref:HesA/MoeB/ThiF family protein n=1 Tax=Sphingomonas sp. LY29 TaxID=3095341 RepID=UPI002D7A04ED|nr:ThiF family adenylyltransferase [Sphingomonas sp. LY29]WRP25512.1 ThiF family adenylyltransferase [Sphingomonas sp. LY29]